jgi:hypothetical protein
MTTPDSKTKSNAGRKPAPQPAPKDDLQALPLAEVEKKLSSTANGLTDAGESRR